jgi:NAD(P)-dependent dehydrogenase (short-subunit alcohol dehydrogenase family)
MSQSGGVLANRVAVVTGGASGIGRSIAERFAGEGARVVLADIRGEVAAEAAAGIGSAARSVAVDVRDWDAVEALYQSVVDDDGHVDVSVHCAGFNDIDPSLTMRKDVWDKIIDINLSGLFACSMHAARVMEKSGGGSIINIASAAAVLPLVGRAPYSASKAAVVGLTRVLAAEWASLGIRVNAIGPGWVMTDLVRDAIAKGRLSEEAIRKRVPMDRLGTTAEVAEVALFLATERSSFFTGAHLVPDGGYTATGIRP